MHGDVPTVANPASVLPLIVLVVGAIAISRSVT
jgi:hypothetical protein